MLQARKPNMWANSYDILSGDQLITRWNRSTFRTGGTFELDGRTYTIRSSGWGTKCAMTTGTDRVVASAERLGRKKWTVQARGHTYEFQRTSVWRYEQALMKQDRAVGLIKRTSMWRSDATADLPELEPAVQIFVFAIVLSMWDDATSEG